MGIDILAAEEVIDYHPRDSMFYLSIFIFCSAIAFFAKGDRDIAIVLLIATAATAMIGWIAYDILEA